MKAAWQPPPRDADYEEVRAMCLERGLVLQSARGYGEALRWGADYRIVEKTSRSQLAEADSLDELRRWVGVKVTA